MNACVCASCCSTRWMSASVSSTGESFRDWIRFESSAIERSWRRSEDGAVSVAILPSLLHEVDERLVRLRSNDAESSDDERRHAGDSIVARELPVRVDGVLERAL